MINFLKNIIKMKKKKVSFFVVLSALITLFIVEYIFKASNNFEISKIQNIGLSFNVQTDNYNNIYNENDREKNNFEDYEIVYEQNAFYNCDKWIVMTTINLPTEHVKYLHDSAFGWCIVVVADKKTPVDWQYKNIYYLSVQKQLDLMKTFEIISQIKYNSYLRKMIGYLFAISKNAKFIYETDDDNAPTGEFSS
jgi:hypothetical protein